MKSFKATKEMENRGMENELRTLENRSDSIKYIANTYGVDSRFNEAIEESSELIQAICKYRSKYKLFTALGHDVPELKAIINEIADVKIVIAQLEYLFNIENVVDSEIERKIELQIQEINDEEQSLG